MSSQGILVPLDGSRLAEAALPWAEHLALALDAQVIVLRAAEAHTLPGLGAGESEVRALETAQQYLGAVVATLVDRGIKAWPITAYGKPGEHIAETAKAHGATLIVMSTHGRSGLSRWVFGSVADQVLRRAAVPVLLVRGLTAPHRPMLRLLVPLDGSSLAEQALGPAEELARQMRMELLLLRVVQPRLGMVGSEIMTYATAIAAAEKEEAWAYLDAVARDLRARGNLVTGAVEVGLENERYSSLSARPGEIITDYAKDNEIGLIAMCSHCRSGLSRLLVGSVATEVLQTAPVPVLLLNPRVGNGHPIGTTAAAGEVESAGTVL